MGTCRKYGWDSLRIVFVNVTNFIKESVHCCMSLERISFPVAMICGEVIRNINKYIHTYILKRSEARRRNGGGGKKSCTSQWTKERKERIKTAGRKHRHVCVLIYFSKTRTRHSDNALSYNISKLQWWYCREAAQQVDAACKQTRNQLKKQTIVIPAVIHKNSDDKIAAYQR